MRLGGEAGVAGSDARPKPRATEGVTQAFCAGEPWTGTERWRPSHVPPQPDRGPAARTKAVTLPTMLAVAGFSTWPTPQTPASKGRPPSPRPSAHTESVAAYADPPPPRQGRAHPPRVAGRHVCARRGVSPTQPVPGDEHEPCPRTCRGEDCASIGRSMPAAPASLPGGAGLPGEGERAGGVHHPALTREMEPGGTRSHSKGLAQPAPGKWLWIAPGGPGWLPLPAVLSPASPT